MCRRGISHLVTSSICFENHTKYNSVVLVILVIHWFLGTFSISEIS